MQNQGIRDARSLGTPKMLVLGLQHMFAMFGATVLVPALTGLSVSATLLFAGLGTLFFHFLTKGKVPAFLGSSFAYLAGYAAIAPNGEAALLPYACVGVAASGLLYLILSALVRGFGANRVMRFFPPVVTGPIIICIGMTLANSAINNCTGKKSVVIPKRAMQEIAAVLSSDDSEVKLIFSSTHIKIDFGGTKVISRLLDGEYVNYKGILPKNFATRVLINCEELKNSTERALLMARESKSNRIKLMFANNTLTITANSEKGNINDEIEIQLVGKDLEIAFNATYIQDVMRVLDDECVYLNMNNAVTPCVIVPVEGEAFYYMILPVRLFTGA